VPFQVACGTVRRCDRDLTGDCERMPPLSMYGFGAAGGDHGGFLSDLVRVPFADAMLVAVPATSTRRRWRARATTSRRLAARRAPPRGAAGADVLIVGGGTRSIGLYAVDLARALGAGASTTSMPTRAARGRERPRRPGLDPDTPLDRRYPITADCSASEAGLKQALRATEPGGHCTHAGIIWGEMTLNALELSTPRRDAHIGRASGAPGDPGDPRADAGRPAATSRGHPGC
jgi:alcohol dehydrogenase